MNRFHKTLAFIAMCLTALFVSGCGVQSGEEPIVDQVRRIQMGDDTMIVIGDDWIFRFSRTGKPCAVVGEGVPVINHTSEHIVVDLRGGMELNVPLSGLHPVLIVNMNGFTNVNIDISKFEDDRKFLNAALKLNPLRPEQGGARQPATAVDSISERGEEAKPESEAHSQ